MGPSDVNFSALICILFEILLKDKKIRKSISLTLKVTLNVKTVQIEIIFADSSINSIYSCEFFQNEGFEIENGSLLTLSQKNFSLSMSYELIMDFTGTLYRYRTVYFPTYRPFRYAY